MNNIKILALLITFMTNISMNAEIASGTCGVNGDNITWVLGNDYTLTLSGSGEMKDYNYSDAPWSKNRDNIKKYQLVMV